MARNDNIIFLSTWICKIMQFIMSGSILILPPYTRGEKNIWSELELNPGPLASQATTLTTRPWLLGQAILGFKSFDFIRTWRVDRQALMSSPVFSQSASNAVRSVGSRSRPAMSSKRWASRCDKVGGNWIWNFFDTREKLERRKMRKEIRLKPDKWRKSMTGSIFGQ